MWGERKITLEPKGFQKANPTPQKVKTQAVLESNVAVVDFSAHTQNRINIEPKYIAPLWRI